MFKKDVEEFLRQDPDASYKFYWLAAIKWILPISIIITGLFISTQIFASYMNYDEEVVAPPLITFPNKYRVYNPLVFFLSMFKYSFNGTYSYYFFKSVPPVLIALIIAALIFIILAVIVSTHQKNQHIYGTARWATKTDLKKYGLLQTHGVVCGECAEAHVFSEIDREKASLTLHLENKNPFTKNKAIAPLVCHSGRTNTWMIAPTRSGKGVSTVVPTCLNYGVPYWTIEKNKKTGKKEKIIKGRGSIIVFDPKGENWEITSGYRSKFSTCIPFRPLDENTAHYNPMNEIPDNEETAYDWADVIASIFFGSEKSKSGGSNDTSEYFNNVARDIFTAVVLHVRFSKNIPDEKKNISRVLEFFSQTNNEANANDEESGPGKKMLSDMRAEGEHVHDDKIHECKIIHEIIVQAANRSEMQNPKERASTYSTVFSKIALFQSPLIKNATRYSDFSIDDFVTAKNGISLYLIVPYKDIARIAPVFRMLITFMIKKFSDGTTNAKEVKLKNPCLFLLDEFPVLGYFPDIAQNAGILAGYGVTFFIVSQSLNQIVDVYGENHPFLDHCKTLILYAPGNIKDARSFSETIGNRSVLLDNISHSGNKFDGGFSNVSQNSQEIQTSLINADELMKLDFTRAIIFNQGMPPYKAKKVVYYEDPRFCKRAWQTPPSMTLVLSKLKKLPSHFKKPVKINADSLTDTIKTVENTDTSIPEIFSIA